MNGNYFILPDEIFEKGLSPIEFALYVFSSSPKIRKTKAIGPFPIWLTIAVLVLRLAERLCMRYRIKPM